jgi:hypothetical protein
LILTSATASLTVADKNVAEPLPYGATQDFGRRDILLQADSVAEEDSELVPDELTGVAGQNR